MCTLERDINVLKLQVNAKRLRLSFLQDQCIAESGSLAKVLKDILGEQAPSLLGTCADADCNVCHPRTEDGTSADSHPPPGPFWAGPGGERGGVSYKKKILEVLQVYAIKKVLKVSKK